MPGEAQGPDPEDLGKEAGKEEDSDSTKTPAEDTNTTREDEKSRIAEEVGRRMISEEASWKRMMKDIGYWDQ